MTGRRNPGPFARLRKAALARPRLAGTFSLLALLAVATVTIDLRFGIPFPIPAETTPRHSMVVAAHPLATKAGLAILREGGGAVDAAIAAALVLNLVEPQASGIGGGGFLVHYAKETGRVETYDGRETAPESVGENLFLDADGKPLAFYRAAVGGRSVGVPGLLRLFELAHREHGKLPWGRLFEPAIALAEEGFPISERLSRLIASATLLDAFAPTKSYFLNADGSPKAAGQRLKNPAFAETLRALAEGGAGAFYEGEIAKAIAEAVTTAAHNPSLLTTADIAAYRARKREPVCRPYRRARVCTIGPPSSGGVTLLQALGILEAFDVGAHAPGSLEAVHLVAEASRLAFADRDRYLADPDFVPQPVNALLDPAYLAERAGQISLAKSLGTAKPGLITGWLPPRNEKTGTLPESLSTTHLSVVDQAGNAVALTASIEAPFGSRLMVKGFLLNNELTDFDFLPRQGPRLLANRVEAGKRPRSSMTPVVVFDENGRLQLALGSPGGPYIIGFVLKTLVAVLDWGMDIQTAIALPNFTNRNGKTELESGTAVAGLAPALERLGHAVEVRELTSGLHGIERRGRMLAGGADPRREGVALGD
ncbi:MAG: gamma-glutamyltransferase [Pseudomonadota bacterium]